MNVIKVEKRDTQAKAKRLRREGIVPCCVYGGGLPDSISIQMEQQIANQLLQTKREGSKVQLDLDGKLIPAQIKEQTRNFLNLNIEHIGFQALQADQSVNSVAHIFLKNAETSAGVLEQMIFEVPYASLPKDMIDTVTVDLADMTVGTVLTVEEIPEFASDRITLQIDPDSMVLRLSDKKRAPTQDAAPEAE